jgi:putative membrane protein
MKAFIALLLVSAACSPNVSQQAHEKGPDASRTQAASLSSQDRDFLEHAAQGSNAEVAMGALVDSHALRPEVIAFGHMMVTDHSAANQKLAGIAAAKNIALPASLGDHQEGFDRIADLHLDPFDVEFVRVMIGDHQQAAELFRAEAATGIDPDLKAFAAATLPVIEAHLAQAKALGAIAQRQ